MLRARSEVKPLLAVKFGKEPGAMNLILRVRRQYARVALVGGPCSLLAWRKIELDDQASGVYLMIRVWSRVVLVLVVGIKLSVSA